MRHPFQHQPDLQITPIEKIRLPLKSRDELPPILAGLQWLWMHPTLKAEIFALLEAKILAGKQATGRPGMDLWQILVLGVVRLGLDADWDRMEHIANYDTLVRQMLGVPATPWGADARVFGHQTLRDNVALLDDELLQQINARIAAAGREVFAKKAGAPGAALEVKVDSYVLETDVHFPTDLSLLWDAGRKCVDLVEGLLASGCDLPGWRKCKAWRRQLKACERTASQIVYRGGPNKEARVKRAVREYLAVGRTLSAKVNQSLLGLCDAVVDAARWERLAYFHGMLDKHLDLVERRLLREETIPAHEKVFSLFEPHTEWIQKGKQRPNVELGHRLLLATDQQQLIQDYAVLRGEAEVDQSVPVADRLLGRYGAGSVASLSFDKGFTRAADRELLRLYIPEVVMPKRGKKNAAETERERGKRFVALRRQHSAVESEINSLEHHGLNRCLDVGLEGYLRYVGCGVLSYNLHVLGREVLARQRARGNLLALVA
ncbi:MAG: ISNCY family transposase [Verrucomicrobia bacterium]|nr:ISNCY family transposase [Verrucomicrobiota bacterium]